MRNTIAYLCACVLAACAFFSSCQNKPEKPQSPEEVLRQYQAYIDKNKFAEAKALSTPAGKEWLSELEEIIADEQADSTMLSTKFISLACEGQGDTVTCMCVLEDQYERYPAEYRLVKMEGHWLVDAPEEEIIIENDIIEAIPDSLLDEMMEEEEELEQ